MELASRDTARSILTRELPFDAFDADADAPSCSDTDATNGLGATNKPLNRSDEDAVVELRAIDAALRAALHRAPRTMNEIVTKGATLDLCADLIEREDEATRAAGTGRRRATSSSETEREEDVPWGTPTKAAVERFAEELEVVLKEKENAVIGLEKALALKREATLAFEQQRARAAQSEKALHFAEGEIVRLSKKVNELSKVLGGSRAESAQRWEKLKKAEKRLAEGQAKDEENLRALAMLRKDLQTERQMNKAKEVEISRLRDAFRDVSNGKKIENAGDEQNLKRIQDLEEKIVQLAVSVSKQSSASSVPPRSNERELNLLVHELAKEELKSRARADAAEQLVTTMRAELDTKTVEVITLRQHINTLDQSHAVRTTSRGSLDSPRPMSVSLEEIDQNLQRSCDRAEQLCQRLSTVMSSGGASTGGYSQRMMGTPLSASSDRSADKIRELQEALDDQSQRRDEAEKLAAKAASDASALRDLITAERIASAAAMMAESRGLTGAYVARGNTHNMSPSTSDVTSTPSRSPRPFQHTPRTTSSIFGGAPVGLSKELEEARRTANKERKRAEVAEETISRWSRLAD